MGLFDWFSKLTGFNLSSFDSDARFSASGDDDFMINPATGLPMTNGIGSIDYAGNPFGMDLNEQLVGALDVMPAPFNNETGINSFDD